MTFMAHEEPLCYKQVSSGRREFVQAQVVEFAIDEATSLDPHRTVRFANLLAGFTVAT
ncbi:hypothetical protein M2119_000813 [Aurantimicrobium minutum]|nr:hypothetical protein [Aurantimicrobium minutum]